MLDVFDILKDFEYFTTDRDPHVRKVWERVKLDMNDIKEMVAKSTSGIY